MVFQQFYCGSVLAFPSTLWTKVHLSLIVVLPCKHWLQLTLLLLRIWLNHTLTEKAYEKALCKEPGKCYLSVFEASWQKVLSDTCLSLGLGISHTTLPGPWGLLGQTSQTCLPVAHIAPADQVIPKRKMFPQPYLSFQRVNAGEDTWESLGMQGKQTSQS